MGGTILIEDSFERQAFFQAGEDTYKVMAGNEFINVGKYRGSTGSAKSDNEEKDFFENTTMRSKFSFGDWTLNTNSQQYEYDYDSCWNANWQEVNACHSEGEKHDVSIRGDWLTVGYSRNDAKFYTEGVETWAAVSERYFVDLPIIYPHQDAVADGEGASAHSVTIPRHLLPQEVVRT